jgi:hypothetical protein
MRAVEVMGVSERRNAGMLPEVTILKRESSLASRVRGEIVLMIASRAGASGGRGGRGRVCPNIIVPVQVRSTRRVNFRIGIMGIGSMAEIVDDAEPGDEREAGG